MQAELDKTGWLQFTKATNDERKTLLWSLVKQVFKFFKQSFKLICSTQGHNTQQGHQFWSNFPFPTKLSIIDQMFHIFHFQPISLHCSQYQLNTKRWVENWVSTVSQSRKESLSWIQPFSTDGCSIVGFKSIRIDIMQPLRDPVLVSTLFLSSYS